MHYIDVCDKKTDRDIFRTLKKDYRDIRCELNSLLFKIHRIDFVEVSEITIHNHEALIKEV
jgi:hypothetical protein